MIIADVNLFVYAYRVESDRHEKAAAWLAGTLGGRYEFGLLDVVLSGFLRIVTSPRVFRHPAPLGHALGYAEAIMTAPGARWVPSTPSTWHVLRRFADEDRNLRGNLIPDAFLAATAIWHGARLATCDRGFARFPDLDWYDPLA